MYIISAFCTKSMPLKIKSFPPLSKYPQIVVIPDICKQTKLITGHFGQLEHAGAC